MEYLRKVFDRTHIKLLIAAGITTVLGLILVLIGTKTVSNLEDQNFASRWSEKKDFSQVTVFFSELSGFNEDGVKELTYKIDKKLLTDSIATPNDNARTWVYAYSANGEVNVSSKTDTTKVRVMGIGGDFFLFHPVELVNGSFFDSEYVMKDLVLLDTETAWRLFGSNDVVGQYVEIGGVPHVVTGVVKKEEGRLNTLAGNDEATIYMSYSSLEKNGKASYINSFETLMPNPITSYALDSVKEVVPVEEKRFEIIENTGRFNFVNLLKRVPKFGTRGMNSKGVIYPYWENIARGVEDYLTPVAVAGCLFFLYPAVLIICILIRMWKKRSVHKSDIYRFFEEKAEDYREKRKRERDEIDVEEIL